MTRESVQHPELYIMSHNQKGVRPEKLLLLRYLTS